jgi:hypothetical protein
LTVRSVSTITASPPPGSVVEVVLVDVVGGCVVVVLEVVVLEVVVLDVVVGCVVVVVLEVVVLDVVVLDVVVLEVVVLEVVVLEVEVEVLEVVGCVVVVVVDVVVVPTVMDALAGGPTGVHANPVEPDWMKMLPTVMVTGPSSEAVYFVVPPTRSIDCPFPTKLLAGTTTLFAPETLMTPWMPAELSAMKSGAAARLRLPMSTPTSKATLADALDGSVMATEVVWSGMGGTAKGPDPMIPVPAHL